MMEKYTIMMVDDESDTLDMMIEYLQKEYEVDGISDSSKVLDQLQTKQYDAILLDINMPKINGLSLCKSIKMLENYEDIPILFVTAYSDFEKIKSGFECGASDYIIKPYDLDDLSIRLCVRIESSKKYFNAINMQMELNEKIYTLTNELKKYQEKYNINEAWFENRENNFQLFNEKIKESKEKSEHFSQQIQKIENKLLEQKKLLEATKKSLLNKKV